MTNDFRIHGKGRRAYSRQPRSRQPVMPVTVEHLHQLAREAAKFLALHVYRDEGSDYRARLAIMSPTEVVVLNQPRRPQGKPRRPT